MGALVSLVHVPPSGQRCTVWTAGIDDAIGALSLDAPGKDGKRVNLKAATLSMRTLLIRLTLLTLTTLLTLPTLLILTLPTTHFTHFTHSTAGGVCRVRGGPAGASQDGQPQPQDEPIQGDRLEELAEVAREPDEHAVTMSRPRWRRRGREGVEGLDRRRSGSWS